MAESAINTDDLARAIVARLPRIPLAATLWDAAQCADYLHQSVRTFERTKDLPDFPAPTLVPVRCWFAADVIDWARGRQLISRGRQ